MIWGAIRNAQLIRVYMPDWKLRVFVPSRSKSSARSITTSLSETPDGGKPTTTASTSGFNRSTFSSAVEERTIASLRRLSAEVMAVNVTSWSRHTLLNNVLATHDVDNIDYIVLRRADWRLGEKEAAALNDWVRAAEQGGPDAAVVHCIHDNIIHARSALVGDLWGFRPAAFRRRFDANGTPGTLYRKLNVDVGDDDSFLGRSIWPRVAQVAYCHDSINTCYGGPPAGSSMPFPIELHRDDGFVGQSYDENHELIGDQSAEVRLIPCTSNMSKKHN